MWGFKSTSQCWKMNFLHLIESFEESLMLDWMKLHLKLFWIWFIHTFIDQCRACWSFFRTFCKVSFWFEVTDAYFMLSLSTISHASYNPSNDFIRIINYQNFHNQTEMESSHFGKHHSLHEPIVSVPHYWKSMGLHTPKHHSQMEQTHTLKARKER